MENLKANRLNILMIFLLMGLVLYIGSGSCSQNGDSSRNMNTTDLVNTISKKKKDSDSIKIRVDTVTKIVTRYITKYKTIRHDSLIPCPEKLALCDTVVITQDSLIRELQTLIKIDSSIISNQDLVIRADSLTKIDLTKKVKTETRKKKFWKVVTAISVGVLAGIMISN